MNWIHTMKKTLSITLFGALPLMAYAAGNVAEDTPPLADTGSAYYRFERVKVDSADGQVHYRLDIAIPKRDAPTSGYPVMYLLDGNNVMAELRDDWLGPLNQGSPPLLVMLGYDIDDRYDMPQRTRDYTGATSAAFLEVLETRIKAEVEKRYAIDRSRQTLWGHSFGGLFVLYALLEKPEAFQTWFAASASLWFQPITYDNGMALQGFAIDSPRTVRIMRGEREGKPPIGQFDDGSAERRKAMAAVPNDANRLLAEHLATLANTDATYEQPNGRNHGQMFTTALHAALRRAAGLPEKP
jgi:predicted alpha/beta superfamily hydrolase